ncbi:MAG: 5'-methylthioadenosine/adenosylhomocysteine nucleosidase [Gammaproteobacteria bacterium]
MPIGILGAMLEEVEILKRDMQDVVSQKIAGRIYYSGMLYGIQTVLVFSRWGKVASAIAATTLITHFQVNSIIFVGVAGAADERLNIGDIVIGTHLYQHDMDARPLFPQFEVPLTNLSVFSAAQILCQHAENAARTFCTEIRQLLQAEALHEFSILQPRHYSGVIASGDCFVFTEAQKTRIKTDMPQALAVEMEGAAIAQVCTEHNTPFVVVRTISDKADASSHIDFPAFIAKIARYYSWYIIQAMYRLFLK